MRGPAVAAVLVPASLVAGHGHLTLPMARTGSQLSLAGTCAFDRCAWYTDNVTIAGPAVNNDPALLTMGIVPLTEGDIYQSHPWRSPGSAPVTSPCGMIANARQPVHSAAVPPAGANRKDGRDLPPGPRETWVAGGEAEVAFALAANHGGGYSYRLCPASDPELSEECFQRTVLTFVNDTAWVQMGADASTRAAFTQRRTTSATTPAGTTWTRNPIPGWLGAGMWDPPAKGQGAWGDGAWGHQILPFNVIDRVRVPDLPAGDYVLSWRWDCEQSVQIWLTCGDVKIVAPGAAAVAAPAPPEPAHLPDAGTMVWRWAGARAGISGRPAVAGGKVLVGTLLATGTATPGGNDTFYALDAATGEVAWSFRTEASVASSAVLGDGTDGAAGAVYFSVVGGSRLLDCMSGVVALDAATGKQLWANCDMYDDVWGTPTVKGGSVYFGSFDNHFHSVDARTGRLQWRFDAGGQCGYKGSDAGGGAVYFSANYDQLYALNATTAAVLWHKRGGGWMYGSPTVHDDTVYVGTSNGTLDAYNARTGELRWQAATGGGVWALDGVTVHRGVIYFGSDDHHLYAVDARTGAVLWRFATGGPVQAQPTLHHGLLYFGSFDHHVYAVDARTGEARWHYETGNFVQSGAAVSDDGTIYIGSYDQSLYSIRAPSN